MFENRRPMWLLLRSLLALSSACGEEDTPIPEPEEVEEPTPAPAVVHDAMPPEMQVRAMDAGTPTKAAPLPDAAIAVDSGASTAGLTCYELRAHGGDFKSSYKVGVAHDAYTAFTLAPPWKQTVYALVMTALLDNTKAIHHWLLYQDDTAGTPGPGVVQVGVHPNQKLIAAWVPGTGPIDLREAGDVGLELPSDTTYTLEIHYNSDDENAEDRTGIEICTSAKKPANTAGYSWLGYENIGFPAATWSGTCKPNATAPIRVLSIVPHMHLKGTHMKITVKRANGSSEVLHDAPFDFAYERLYQTDLTLLPGDAITTDCTYSEPMSYGPRTIDEMCYVFTMAYPKGALVAPDFYGSFAHGGASCFGQ